MHFGGVVTGEPTTEGKTGADVGTVVVDTASGKEYVLVKVSDSLKWEVIGDQNTYATNTTVTAVQTDVTYLSSQIDSINAAGYVTSTAVDDAITAKINGLDVLST